MQFFNSLITLAAVVGAVSAAAVNTQTGGIPSCIYRCLDSVGRAHGCEDKQCLCDKAAELEFPLEECVGRDCGADKIPELRCIAARECNYKPERCPRA